MTNHDQERKNHSQDSERISFGIERFPEGGARFGRGITRGKHSTELAPYVPVNYRRIDSLGGVENPAALFAAHDLFAVFDPVRGLRGDLHVAAGTNFVLQGDNGGVSFARK